MAFILHNSMYAWLHNRAHDLVNKLEAFIWACTYVQAPRSVALSRQCICIGQYCTVFYLFVKDIQNNDSAAQKKIRERVQCQKGDQG